MNKTVGDDEWEVDAENEVIVIRSIADWVYIDKRDLENMVAEIQGIEDE